VTGRSSCAQSGMTAGPPADAGQPGRRAVPSSPLAVDRPVAEHVAITTWTEPAVDIRPAFDRPPSAD
jgi:hypothetical protein